RVGANSPSLCPTMVSVTNTGMCLRPSCTAIVWPSMAGTIIERRDQVLITFLLLASFCAATLRKRCSSTKGPFLRLRGIFYPLFLFLGYLRFLPTLRRRTMSLSLSRLGLRVRPSDWPQGLTG